MARSATIYSTLNVDTPGAWEPKQQHRFLAILLPPQLVVPLGPVPSEIGKLSPRALMAMCRTTKRPVVDVGGTPTKVNFLHEQAAFAGKPENAQTIDLTFRDGMNPNPSSSDTSPYDVMRSLYEWSRLVYDPYNGTMGFKTEYQGKMYLSLLDPHGVPRETWTFFRIWPTKLDGGQLTYDNSGEIDCVASFQYDKVTNGRVDDRDIV